MLNGVLDTPFLEVVPIESVKASTTEYVDVLSILERKYRVSSGRTHEEPSAQFASATVHGVAVAKT